HLDDASQKFLEPFGIERLLGAEHEGSDLIVMVRMMMILMAAMGVAFAFMIMLVLMLMAVFMAMIVIMRGIRMFVGKEVRVDVQYGVQVESTDVQQHLQVRYAKIDRR